MQISVSLVEQLQSWQAAGKRKVELTIDALHNSQPNWNIWIYDYELRSGVFITNKNIESDWDVLLIDALRAELANLEQKIGGKSNVGNSNVA
ncbi:MAG: hypothetical protein ACRDBM_05225 [Sporomusa sp.]